MCVCVFYVKFYIFIYNETWGHPLFEPHFSAPHHHRISSKSFFYALRYLVSSQLDFFFIFQEEEEEEEEAAHSRQMESIRSGGVGGGVVDGPDDESITSVSASIDKSTSTSGGGRLCGINDAASVWLCLSSCHEWNQQ